MHEKREVPLKRIVEFPLAQGGSVLAEVETSPSDQLVPASLPSEIAGKAAQTLESAIESIRPAVSAVMGIFRKLSNAPEEIEMEFGIKLSAKLGAILASADGETNYKVTIKWKGQSDPSNDSHL